ncbi:MAG: ribonuclease P protein component [Oscillospiraceae bacterium]
MQFSTTLKNNFEFRRIYARGKSAVSRNIVLYCRRNKSSSNRLGITVSAKLACAVRRNRVRRRLREVYRLNEHRLSPGWDIVIVVRGRGILAPYSALEGDFLALAEKLELIK